MLPLTASHLYLHSCFETVAEVFHDASHARYYELAKEQLAMTRKLAAELAAWSPGGRSVGHGGSET